MRAPLSRRAPGKGVGEHRQEEGQTNLYDEVTARIITKLKGGSFPWGQPWGGCDGGGALPGLPRNALTARTRRLALPPA